MNIMDVEVGSRILADDLEWTLLDFFTDSALCILNGVLPERTFGSKDWETSRIRKFLNEEFSLRLSIGKIRNTRYDSKVFLLSKGMFLCYSDWIPEASCNWWLMPEGGNPLIVTNTNWVVSIGNRTPAGVRPVVRYARDMECLLAEQQNPLIEPGQSFTVNGSKLIFLAHGRRDATFLCMYEEPIHWKWDGKKSEQENFESMEQFVVWDLKCVPAKDEWQEVALNGDKVEARVGRVSLLDLTRYRMLKPWVPAWEGEWMLSTKVSGEPGACFLSVKGNEIRMVKTAAIRPVVLLSEEDVYGNWNRR